MKGSSKSTLQNGWAVYLRTSTAEPRGHIAAQRIIIQHEVIADSDLPILREYVETDCCPDDPSQLHWLLIEARQGKFSHVAVASLDRLSRDHAECERILADLEALGITVRVGNADESPVSLF